MDYKRELKKIEIFFLIKSKIGLKKVRAQIRDAQIKIVEGCNSRCITCDIWKKNNNNEMSLKTYRKVIKELKKVGLKSVGLTGGEPLLNTNLVEICKVTKKEELNLSISTNGLLLNRKIEEIAKYVDNLSISLDGLEKTNDDIRGIKGYFKLVTSSIEDIRKKNQKIKISISTTITNSNFDEIEEILKWCKRNRIGWSANLLMNSLYFFKEAKVESLKVIRKKVEINRFKKMLLKYEKEGVVNISTIAIDYLTNFLKNKQKAAPCCLGLTTAYIDCEANYYSGCWAMLPIGNLKYQKLENIFESKVFKNRIQKMYELKCPGCTCGYDQNWEINNYGNWMFRKIKKKLKI